MQTGRQCFGDAVQTNLVTRQGAGFDFVIASNTAPGAATTKLGITYKFRPEGDTLVVESTMRDASGPKQVGTVYRRTTRGPSMVEFEFLCLAQRAGGLVYTAMPNGGGMTDFLSTKVSADSITFENPDHDFPKAIVYTKRADGGVDVTISGAPGQRALTYSFKKKQ